jgi:hypothetical protein
VTNVLIRDVPEDDIAQLRADARAQGKSLQAYMLDLVHERAAAARNRRVVGQVAERLAATGPQVDDTTAVDVIAEARSRRSARPDRAES